jgi:hypothetical protein
VEFTADVITLALTYGVLNNLDVGALVPYVLLNRQGDVDLTVSAAGTVTITPTDPTVAPTTEAVSTVNPVTVSDDFDDDFDGFGDIILFVKLQLLSETGLIGDSPAPLDLALQVELKLPTGDEDEFLGTGDTDVAGRLILQKEIIQPLLRVRGEVGYNVSGTGSEFDTVEGKLGLEFVALPSLAFSVEAIVQDSDEFGSIIDGVVGAKLNTFFESSIFGGVRFPLNDNGLRSSIAPIIGLEKTFRRPFGGDTLDDLPPRDLPPDYVPFEDAPKPEPAPTMRPEPEPLPPPQRAV